MIQTHHNLLYLCTLCSIVQSESAECQTWEPSEACSGSLAVSEPAIYLRDSYTLRDLRDLMVIDWYNLAIHALVNSSTQDKSIEASICPRPDWSHKRPTKARTPFRMMSMSFFLIIVTTKSPSAFQSVLYQWIDVDSNCLQAVQFSMSVLYLSSYALCMSFLN